MGLSVSLSRSLCISSLMAPNNKLPTIPSEIIFDILSRLPIKSLCRFKTVSKPFLAMINPLIKACLENKSQKVIIASNTYPCSFYTLDPRSLNDPIEIKNFFECWFEILGSCNGILLLRSSLSTLFLWNPLTQERRLIISPKSSKDTIIQGLGYNSFTDDFKVVMAITHSGSPNHTCAYVYSSISSYWKRVGDFGYNKYLNSPGAILNGSPHWIVCQLRGPSVIIYFDPCEDTFGQLPFPVIGSRFSNFRLIVLGGDLCGVNDNSADNSVDVWVMKESSWSKMFVMLRGQGEFSARMLTPLVLKGGEDDGDAESVVVQLNNRGLALYNLKENIFEKIELDRDCDRFNAACYVETIVSL